MEKYKIYWQCNGKDMEPFEIESADVAKVSKIANDEVQKKCAEKGANGEYTKIEKVEK